MPGTDCPIYQMIFGAYGLHEVQYNDYNQPYYLQNTEPHT